MVRSDIPLDEPGQVVVEGHAEFCGTTVCVVLGRYGYPARQHGPLTLGRPTALSLIHASDHVVFCHQKSGDTPTPTNF